jgi:acyl CoA:acetate/3-ketoacid CoA transferase alpha subunit
MAENFGAAIERLIAHRDHVLEADGNAQQRFLAMRRAGGQGLVGGVGLRQGIGGVVTEEGVKAAIDALNLFQAAASISRAETSRRPDARPIAKWSVG